MSKFVKLNELINACVTLSHKSGKIVRNIAQKSDLKVVQKSFCSKDVCTEADLQIQKTIQHNLSALYPNSKIICEEDDQEIPDRIQPAFQPDQLIKSINRDQIFTPDILSKSAQIRRVEYLKYLYDLLEFNYAFINASDVRRGLDSGFSNEVLEEDLTFWIDPLDGSSGLAEGHTEHLTTIIGVSIKGRPLLGVVHKPYIEHDSGLEGRTYVGAPKSGLFIINHSRRSKNNQLYTQYIPPFYRDQQYDKHLFRPRICGSHNRNQDQMNKILYSMRPEQILRVAGSGNKFVHMADNKSDIYLNFVPGFKHWDMCGSEAILQARFGIVTDAMQGPLFYDSVNGYTQRKGIIAAKSKQVYEICSNRIWDGTGLRLEMNHELVLKDAQEQKRLLKIQHEQLKPLMASDSI